MSDELTAELRRVYLEVWDKPWDYIEGERAKRMDAALLAVARHSAERQRGMEATGEMMLAGRHDLQQISENERHGQIQSLEHRATRIYRAMQSAAPLWVDKK